MNLHEYQAKGLLRDAGVPVPQGVVIETVGELEGALDTIGLPCVLKAQIHAGARGKAGGVKLVKTAEEAEQVATQLLGSQLATPQTGGRALPVNALLVEQTLPIAEELYLSLLIDRASKRHTFVLSSAGGMDIEAVAAETPEKIITLTIDPVTGVMPYQAREAGFALGLTGDAFKQLGQLLQALYRLALDMDLGLVEINPLVRTEDNRLVALDAKVNVDDNALYRHADLQAMHDPSQEDPREAHARKFNLNYIALDGNIGCMVNGAGLAMATMDLIKLHGGEPANFLDVGGGATAERVAEAFKLITSSDEVKAILVNIFGGIVRCDLIAEGIIQAVKEVGLTLPVVVRLEGTNVEQGRRMLAESGLNLSAVNDLEEAAKTVVALAKEAA
ncbi:succinyl-CoA synthetase (ADP-forming) beta subunit [Sulfurivirga caldicuralii]|uniref:Succinate--CoA ligase [ADP-forming] subunit beta n=1 Tax=Sulfurivirga caldicuralii TaxID=364032 RepID=A0A1N6DSP0_9GAMM|nr:ADP-forming succinate--CoA ligase subunit beta [Sulfurivirga caldicuralii]SIN73760.1 succinyl-CoA synthetase (ADP-forming) beta subunit [Sulfurivirga caldicuralii]